MPKIPSSNMETGVYLVNPGTNFYQTLLRIKARKPAFENKNHIQIGKPVRELRNATDRQTAHRKLGFKLITPRPVENKKNTLKRGFVCSYVVLFVSVPLAVPFIAPWVFLGQSCLVSSRNTDKIEAK